MRFNLAENGDQDEGSSPADKTVELVKSMHDAQFTRKEDLDENANWLMSTAATVAALYMGFGTVIATKLFSQAPELAAPTVILITGMSIFMVSIFFANQSSVLRNFYYPFDVTRFVKSEREDGTFEFDEEAIEKYRKFDPEKFYRLTIKIYTISISHNRKTNDIKSMYLLRSQYVFFAGVVTIPLYLLSYAILIPK